MTPKQYELLKFIRNHIVHSGKGPTFKEMRDFMDVKSNQTIDDFLSILEREGFIVLEEGIKRGISVTAKTAEMEQRQTLSQPLPLPQTFATHLSNASTASQFVTSSNETGVLSRPSNLFGKETDYSGTA